jgi:transcriptional regulator with XRE-family HTH domain
MVNIEDFIKRLELILDYYGLNASSFADKIGVQRSSLSHLLSGRNKPSLDFILKISEVFPEVDLYWILIGKGSFPKSAEKIIERVEKKETPFEELLQPHIPAPLPPKEEMIPENLFSEIQNPPVRNLTEIPKQEIQKPEFQNIENHSTSSEVEKIVFFYRNGTFKVFNPS